MAFFHKLFAGRGSEAYHTGVTLHEQGRSAEAIPLLRAAYEQDPRTPRGSLAGLHLRQALVGEARRLLQAGEAEAGAGLLAEAVERWPDFPDLQFQAGAALAFAGAWGGALAAARQALRRNPDYCEARLLEASALRGLERVRDARASLDSLLESGRRVDHELVGIVQGLLDGAPADSCPDLIGTLRRTAFGDDAKRSVAEAVALCRAGRWQEGLAALGRLSERHPRYPDVRAKHAAALYQAGRIDEALVEAEAALGINPRYRTAVSLKGLILAERGDLLAAHEFLAAEVPRVEGTAGRHEELFLAYLRAVLALLLGDLEGCRERLTGWNDLPRHFARAELLLAACDDLDGLPDAALRRVEDLLAIWIADLELTFLRIALLLRQRQLAAAQSLLAQWPGGHKGYEDPRPLLLRARLNLAQDRQPVLPDAAVTQQPAFAETIDPAAWRQLAAAAHLQRGEAKQARDLALSMLDAGEADEETGSLLLRAAAACGGELPADLPGRIGPPDSWVPDLCRLLRHRGQGGAAEALVLRRRSARPDQPRWSWLSATFWLDPVRRWLS